MARLFTEDEVRQLIDAAVAQAIAPLLTRIAELEAEVARLKKNSTTSSKPPSSDIVKPPREMEGGGGRRKKRRRGGQLGHPRHQRAPFPPEQVDESWAYEWAPEDCRGWKPLEEFRVVQQVELVDKPFRVIEHWARRYRCRATGKVVTAALPAEVVRSGLVGPRLSALLAYLKGACHLSYGSLRKFLADVGGLQLSTGQLVKVVMKASAALADCHDQLRAALPEQERLGVDETGHPEARRGLWTWCFHVPGPQHFSWFTIDPSRGSDVLKRILGKEFRGVLHCDYFSAYRKYLADTDLTVQFCWAHLIRDIAFLTTLPDRVTKRWGEKLLREAKRLFRAWHRRGKLPRSQADRQLRQRRGAFLALATRPPPRSEARNLAERLRLHRREYFTFLELPDVEPTNNGTERAHRFVVIDRKVTQGTRGLAGRHWCERIWTTVATCTQQQRSVFRFLHDSVLAHLVHGSAPSLLPQIP
jgi:transposase